MTQILIINGPNLNHIGKREQKLYGNQDFDSWLKQLRAQYPKVKLDYFQSNHAGELIDKLQTSADEYDGIIINAGAYTHTSLALGDAVATVQTPVIEVHLTNTLSREKIRHQSHIGPHCKGIIMGFGLTSYRLALESLLQPASTE